MWWILYEYYVMFMRGGETSWFFKASLRIFYISLFECKGPWMLKTAITAMWGTENYKTRLKKYHVECC